MAVAPVARVSLKFVSGMLKIQHTYDMTTYPNIIDGYSTLPTVSGATQEDVAINDLRAAVLAMETELGIIPRGVYSDTRARLDILESRLSYSVAPNILNDGYVKSPLYVYNVPSAVTLSISDGYNVPSESRLNGSLFMRADGAANSDLYIRRGGTWNPIQTDLFVAAGDLSGTYLTQNVIKIQNKSLNSSLATIGATQDGYALSWDNADGYWRANSIGSLLGAAGGDLRGSYPNPTVASLTGTAGMVNSLTPITITSGADLAAGAGLYVKRGAVGSVLIGPRDVSFKGGIWFDTAAATPTTNNFSLMGNGSDTYIGATGTIYGLVNGLGAFQLASTLFSVMNAGVAVFSYTLGLAAAQTIYATASSFILKQADGYSASSGVGAATTIQAQNMTGITTTGGNLVLSAGTGTLTNGIVQFPLGDLSIGVNPAVAGTIRMPNVSSISCRNNLNTADRQWFSFDSANYMHLGRISVCGFDIQADAGGNDIFAVVNSVALWRGSSVSMRMAVPQVGYANAYGAVDGLFSKAMAGSTYALTSTEYIYKFIEVTGTGTNIIQLPNATDVAGYTKYIINNGSGTLAVQDAAAHAAAATLAAGMGAWFLFRTTSVKQLTAAFAVA